MPSLLDRPGVTASPTPVTTSPLQRPFDTRHLDAEFRQDASFLRRLWNSITSALGDLARGWTDARNSTMIYTIYGLEMRPTTASRCCSDEPLGW